MKINYNAAAMMAVNTLNKNDENVSVSTGRLSSGYKINRAKDNPSGYAMSRKMRAQLDGLLQARDNTDTGINIIKAVDGALSEVHDMLQRMNELAIKGANGTYSDGDRELVDEEVQKLKEEVQRISETFEFNGQKLLNGSFQLKGYVEDELSVKVAGYNDRMRAGEYTFDLSGFKNTEIKDGANTIKKLDLYDKNGNFIAENVYDLWREKVTVPGYQIAPDGSLAIKNPSGETNQWGTLNEDGFWEPLKDGADVTLPAVFGEATNPNKEKEGLGYLNKDGEWQTLCYLDKDGAKKILPQDWKETTEFPNPNRDTEDPEQDTLVTVKGPDGKYIEPLYVSDANGTALTIKGPDGFEIKLDITESFLKDDPTGSDDKKKDIKINLTGLGAMTIQVGANEGQELKMEVPGTGVKELGIDLIKTSTKEDSLDAITRVGVAINRLSGIRSKLGAYQNRMESIVASNEVNHENMSSAYSGILDTDMSEEYTRYSTYQVLSQASTSVLAQANERPAQVLQLLQ